MTLLRLSRGIVQIRLSISHRRRGPAKKKVGAAKLRTWRVSILRNRVQFLGFVEAPDRQTAEAAAAKQFNISEEQRTRLIVQERD
jgi:hypothetical protein